MDQLGSKQHVGKSQINNISYLSPALLLNKFASWKAGKHSYLLNFGEMKNFTKILFLIFLTTGCNTAIKQDEQSKNENKLDQKELIVSDTIPKVTGIGGIFFRSKNPQETRAWYGKNLGLAIDDYGSPFEFRNANQPEEINYLRWSPFDEETEYFAPSEKEFMINYRVQNIEGLVKILRSNGVIIVDEIEEFEYGKFIHIMDPEGNKIELWEPIDSFFTQMGGATTK